MRLVVGDFGFSAGGWRVDRHPRFVTDVTGDGYPDIVGFGDAGVWVARNNGDGTFAPIQLGVGNFGYSAGGWRVERHPRFVVDLTGDGGADVVGFGDGGVWVARSNGDGTFADPQLVVANFGYAAGGWRVERHPRLLTDVTGDGVPDIVGFGDGGVWVAPSNGDGTFAEPQLGAEDFGYGAGGWRVERHPRFLADLTGDGRADVVGFGDGGTWTALGNGDGTFAAPQLGIADFGYSAGGWRVERHPRAVTVLEGDGQADLVGFGDLGVWTARGQGDGTFEALPVLTRRDVWQLTSAAAPWDPITEAYARAVGVMQSRPVEDPTSWAFQAAIHGTYRPTAPGVRWNECKHGGWYFFSWHRMYLYFFERILRAAAAEAGGPDDFALPYWDYAGPSPRNTLPAPFRQPTLADGSPNPLFLPAPLRSPGIMNGGGLPPSATSSTAALAQTAFVGTTFGFGGGVTGTAQFNGSTGALEQTPHNGIHVLLGGSSDGACGQGLMSDPSCAALDPIFWLHHSNIDRLWNRWIALGGGRANPTEGAWLDQPFPFYDETGALVSLTGAEIIDTVGQLGYTYGDEVTSRMSTAGAGTGKSDESGELAPSADADADADADAGASPVPAGPPELAAATDAAVELTGGVASVVLSVPASTADLVTADAVGRRGRTVYLNVEDIEAERNPGVVYGVYVNLPSDPSADDRARHHVGNISLFGIEIMNDPDRAHDGPPGMRHTFDVSPLLGELAAAGAWDPDAITVTFEPLGLLPPVDDGGHETADVDAFRGAEPDVPAAAERPVRLGRVSLFVA